MPSFATGANYYRVDFTLLYPLSYRPTLLSGIILSPIVAAGWQPIIFEDRYYSPEDVFKCIVLRALDSNQDKH
jgi:hypothetical protein